jgi:hypothetical protein
MAVDVDPRSSTIAVKGPGSLRVRAQRRARDLRRRQWSSSQSALMLLMPEQSKRLLGEMRTFLTANQNTIMLALYAFMCVTQISTPVGPMFG